MTTLARLRYTGYRFPAEIISHAIWLYFRFPLGLRMVEEFPVPVTGPTVRRSSPPARHLVVLSVADVCAPGGALTLLPGFRQRQM